MSMENINIHKFLQIIFYDQFLCFRVEIEAKCLYFKKWHFAHNFGGYDVINECTLFMHLVKLTKFTLGPIARKVIIGYTQPWYQIKSHYCASFTIWYLIITQLVLEIFKNKTVSLSNNQSARISTIFKIWWWNW